MLGSARALKNRLIRDYRATRVASILSDPTPPTTLDAEHEFERLQSEFPPLPEYGYDDVSLAQRAADRLTSAFGCLERKDGPMTYLDVGAGDGTLGAMLAGVGHCVFLCDLQDWRKPAARNLRFDQADCCTGLPYEHDTFDLVTSFNSFEHMADPAAAFAELVRVTKPGGIIYLDFGPLYASPWGLHAYRSLLMPYPQYLFSKEFITAKLRELGISDLGEERTELQFVNGWCPRHYEAVWASHNLEPVAGYTHSVQNFWYLVQRYPACFRGRNLTYEDITTANLKRVFRKPSLR